MSVWMKSNRMGGGGEKKRNRKKKKVEIDLY